MKLLLMGAGYVGMELLKSLQLRSYELYITTTKVEKIKTLKKYGKEVLCLNSHNEHELRDLILACDGMIILIAPNNSNYEETYLGTAKRIACVLQGRVSPFYLLYTSSTSVCEGCYNWVTEDMILAPVMTKAKILYETEQVYLQSKANTCILRLGGIYGPYRELAARARRFSGIELPGPGDEPTNHIHLEDIVSAIEFCIDQSLVGVYHLVNDDHRTRKELYSAMCQTQNIPPPHWNPSLSHEGNRGYKISNRKIKDAGFQFKHP